MSYSRLSCSLLNGTAYHQNYGAKDTVTYSNGVLSRNSSPPPPIITYSSSSSSDSQGRSREWVVALCSLTDCLASIVIGMVMGFSSPALTQLQFNVTKEYRISDDDIKFSLFAVRYTFIIIIIAII